MENNDNHVSYYKTTITSTNYTFFYEDVSQNKNEKSKNYEWKNEKNSNGKRSRKKNYQGNSSYYNQNKKREIYKKEKSQFTDNEKNNYYSVRDNKQKKLNFKNIKNNIFFDNNNNENCQITNNNKVNNSEVNNKHNHYSRNKNNSNNFNKYNRNIATFIKNEKRAYYDNNGNINSISSPTNSDDNFRLTKELLEDLDKRNKDMDEENDDSCNNNNNTNDFLIYVKKKIEEKKENVTKRRKNNWTKNDNNYKENNFDNYILSDIKDNDYNNIDNDYSNIDNDYNNIDNSYKYTKEASSDDGNYNEYVHNIDTYKTINNDNTSIFSDESTKVFINKKNKVSINMCDNPCDMWYGLKDRNGKNVFIDSVKNRDNKKHKKKKKLSSKTKNIKKYYINKKKEKYDKWGDNYYTIVNSDTSSISGNTIATMHIDGNNKYNKKNIFLNSKNNIPYNSNGYNNDNNNNVPNFKIFYNKNNLSNGQNDKVQKKNILNHNYHQLAKNDIKNKNNITRSGKNNIVNNNGYNYGHKSQFELSKNIKKNYYENKTINTSIRIKLPDNKIGAFAENCNPCTSDNMSKSLELINNGVISGDLNSQNINNTHISDTEFKDNCINSNDNNNDDSINDYYYHRDENKINMLCDYMNSALSSAVSYSDPNCNTPIENNHINCSENIFPSAIINNNVKQKKNYEKNIYNNNNIPTCEKNNNINYNLELHHLKLNNISNYSESNIVEFPDQNNQSNNALLHIAIDGVGINNRVYYSQSNNKKNEYNVEDITISNNSETHGIGNITHYDDNNATNNATNNAANSATNLHSNKFSNSCEDNSKETYMTYSSIVTKSLPHINDNNNNYPKQKNHEYANSISYYNSKGEEGIVNKIGDNNVNIKNSNNNKDYIYADQNQNYKNYYYNNTKFDLSYEMDDDMRRRKKKKKWNVSFDYKSTFKSARERVQSILANKRGVKY